MKTISSISLILGVLIIFSSQAIAISDNIRSNRENECAIWLCLPGGFAQGCESARSAYIARITDIDKKGTRRYTDLPSFTYCVDEAPPELLYKPEKDSVMTYRVMYEVHMPAYNTCTRWKNYHVGNSTPVTVCAAVQTTPARVFFSSQQSHRYKTINVGDKNYKEGIAPVRRYTEVLVDGVVVGEKWYE